jgi:hypothetical protein
MLTIADALATPGSSAGSIPAACNAGVVTANENIRRRRTPKASQLAATVS